MCRYPLDGTEARNRRRDQRGGGSFGRAEATPEGMVVHYRWNAPHPGTIRELFKLTPDGEMHLVGEGLIEGVTYRYTLVHRRPGVPAPVAEPAPAPAAELAAAAEPAPADVAEPAAAAVE